MLNSSPFAFIFQYDNYTEYRQAFWFFTEDQLSFRGRYKDVTVTVVGDDWYMLPNEHNFNMHDLTPFISDFWLHYTIPCEHALHIAYADVRGPNLIKGAEVGIRKIFESSAAYRETGTPHLSPKRVGYRMHIIEFKNIDDYNLFYDHYCKALQEYFASERIKHVPQLQDPFFWEEFLFNTPLMEWVESFNQSNWDRPYDAWGFEKKKQFFLRLYQMIPPSYSFYSGLLLDYPIRGVIKVLGPIYQGIFWGKWLLYNLPTLVDNLIIWIIEWIRRGGGI